MPATWPGSVRRERLGLVVFGAVLTGLLLAAVVAAAEPLDPVSAGPGQDARAYWTAPLGDPYANSTVGRESAYLYSPAFVQALAPLKALPWPAFLGAWTVVVLAALFYLGRPVLLGPLLAIAVIEVWGGNVHLLLACAVVLGFRWPAAWAFVLLTKVTPGVGLLWFAVRREWRSLAIAVAATLAVAGASWVFSPAAWQEWVAVLAGNAGQPVTSGSLPVPLIVRLPLALLLVAWGARTDRRWTVPVAAMLALPVVWYGSLTMLLALVALHRERLEEWVLARVTGSGPAAGSRGRPELAGSPG